MDGEEKKKLMVVVTYICVVLCISLTTDVYSCVIFTAPFE